MIVNTAYMFMGEKGPSVNPNIWEGGTVNYPYQLYGYSRFEPENSRFMVAADDSVTFTLPLKKFTKITFIVQAPSGRQGNCTFWLRKTGANAWYMSFTPSTTAQSIVVNIPAEFQDDNVIVESHSSSMNNLYLLSGVMS